MSFTTVTVTASYQWLGGPSRGTVTFQLSQTMTDTSNGATVIPAPIPVNLDEKGNLTVNLTATNDPTTTPTNVYYHVAEVLDRFPVRRYGIVVPHTTSPVALTALPYFAFSPPQ